MTSRVGRLTPAVTRVSLPKPVPLDVATSTESLRRSTMSQSSTLFIGMDVHKDTIAVAYIAQEHGAEVTYLVLRFRISVLVLGLDLRLKWAVC